MSVSRMVKPGSHGPVAISVQGRAPGDVRPLGKVVLAVAGDVISLSRDDIRVNGTVVPNSAAASEDSQGRPLQR
ncbi:MAG: hypothetical protein ACREM1_16855, partial [Longimicrobiales bacterium]